MSYESVLEQITLSDEKFVVLTSENRAAIRNLPEKLGNRFVDVGIMEQGMIGAAAGLALRGRTPILHALAAFLTMRSYEFARTDIGLPGLPVKLVGSVAGFFSEANGPTHQAIEDVGLMANIPNMNVFCPADEQDLLIGLPPVLNSPEPYYIRFNNRPAVFEHSSQFEPGKAETVFYGNDLTILVYGFLFTEALEAQRILASQGLSVRLINLRTVKPLDNAAILRATQETKLLVTLEDHFLSNGLFSIISQLLVRQGLAVPVLPLALENKWFRPGLLPDVLEYEGFTGTHIANRILAAFQKINE